ncbi:MAG: hypothetical protein R3F34_04405 [Planctomycetota bacterium]
MSSCDSFDGRDQGDRPPTERGGARYDRLLTVPAGGSVDLVLPFADFGLQQGSTDADGHLDPDRSSRSA